MKRILTAAAAAIAAVALAATPALASPGASHPAPAPTSLRWSSLAAGSEPDSNPLKGFIPFAGDYTAFPYTMEWAYFPLNSVMTGPNTFDWSSFDAALDQIAARGHQTALRFYLDYPGRPSGVPQYLLDGGLTTHSYDDYGNNGVSVSPNYDDPNLRAAMDSFVSALGARYDGDPRIGFLQAGLIGFWGEWHTYPYNGDAKPENWMPSDSTQAEVLNDYIAAFPHTQLEVRNPNGMNAALPIGYHDDSFALETKTSSLGWHFMDNMIAAGAQDKWKTYSIGGELRPELQSCIFSAAGCPVLEDGGDNDFPGSVAQTHASWLIDHYAFQTGYSAADKPAALAGAKSLGYSFRATRVALPQVAVGGQATVGLTVSNVGVAPFYYDWPITLALLDGSGNPVRTITTTWHLADVASGATHDFTGTFDVSGLRGGTYRVLAQGTNPLPNGAPIRFANAAQDSVRAGWLTLGSVRVAAPQGGGHGGGHGPGHGPGHSSGPGAGGHPPVGCGHARAV